MAKALGYDQADVAVLRHVDEDDRTKHTVIDRKGRTQKAYVINRSYKNQSMRFGMWLE